MFVLDAAWKDDRPVGTTVRFSARGLQASNLQIMLALSEGRKARTGRTLGCHW